MGVPMNGIYPLARLLITTGLLILGVGIIMLISSKLRLSLFRLPGDIVIKRDNFTFYFPWVTGIVISIVLSLILGLFVRR